MASKATIDPLITLNLASASYDLEKFVPVFAALRIALKELETYYGQEPLPAVPPDQRQYPYYNKSPEGEATFTYVEPLTPRSDRLLFIASPRSSMAINSSDTVATPVNPYFALKLVKRYGTDAHKFCAQAGFAPKIFHVEKLAGGWLAVSMEFIAVGEGYKLFRDLGDKEREDLGPALRQAVQTMHEAGYVHGDLRRANVFGNHQKRSVQIVDWDWAGTAGTVQYPLMAIPSRLGIAPLRLISKEHDLARVEAILESGTLEDVLH